MPQLRSASAGSTREALRAGTTQATNATRLKSSAAATTTSGSRELPSAQCASTLCSDSVSTSPAAIPEPTLTTVDA
ncbi:MAG: hypothetical protein WCB58_15095, partial [Acidobacteriaceae bacterium]